MLGQALSLTLLLLLKGHQGQEAPAESLVALAGTSLWLQPHSMQTRAHSVDWRVKLSSKREFNTILTWKNESVSDNIRWFHSNLSNRFSFVTKNLTLLIKEAQQQDSGLYVLEVTNNSGGVCRHQFCVSVFEHVGKPLLCQRGKLKAVDRGTCQVNLSCSVTRGANVNCNTVSYENVSYSNVSYTWYRGSELIRAGRDLSTLEEQIDAKGEHTYTCSVSNPVSRANYTRRLTCASTQQEFSFLIFLVPIVFLIITLPLGALGYFCVRRRKRKQSQPSPEEMLTIYEEINNLPIRRNQEQQQSLPGEGSTIYSRIHSQPSASTSPKTENTLYSLVQPSRKVSLRLQGALLKQSGSKKRNHSSSFISTVYEEVGKRQPKAQRPIRLSQKELENFCAYS
ncbi:natural killer cell receptor 2B4 isoform X3 [Rhinolophus ferrumequinum]|uniref:natural killer cell receptor 2B4 isoform X3 n=1 Tax=Rhinolophus ferrumequinum TaxID=59479 RepID=UPI00140F5EE4|nr:natural killer cell receptor 2B4 isoform X3 [Rhinolophus ferrumequinum]